MNPLDVVTNYGSRYGYSARDALRAEFWWRLEHAPIERVRRIAYPRRKHAERHGARRSNLDT